MAIIVTRAEIIERLEEIRDEEDERDFTQFTDDQLIDEYCSSGCFSHWHTGPEDYEHDLRIG